MNELPERRLASSSFVYDAGFIKECVFAIDLARLGQ